MLLTVTCKEHDIRHHNGEIRNPVFEHFLLYPTY